MDSTKSRRREKRRRQHSSRDSSSSDDSRTEKYSKKSKSLREHEQRGSRREEENPVLPKSPRVYDEFDVASRNFNLEVSKSVDRSRRMEGERNSSESPPREKQRRRKESEEVQRRKERRRNSSHDEEPPRRKERRRNSSGDEEPARKKESRRNSSDDEEPSRKKESRRKSSSDEEPPRRKQRRRNSSSDDEPPRRKERHRKPEPEDVPKKNKHRKETIEDVPREKPRRRDNSDEEPRGTKRHRNSNDSPSRNQPELQRIVSESPTEPTLRRNSISEGELPQSSDDLPRNKADDSPKEPQSKNDRSEKKRRKRSRSRSRNRGRNSSRSPPYRRERDFDRRTDYRQEVPGKRYWDAGLSNSRNRRHSGSEEPVIGDRFYGGTPRQNGREDRNGRNDRNSRDDRNNRNNRNDNNDKNNQAPEEHSAVIKPNEKRTVDLLTSKTGGAYIPPAKLKLMQAEITDKNSTAYQRIAWEALKKSIHGHLNKINKSNIGLIIRGLFKENIIRGRGVLTRLIMQAQVASPMYTSVYAALIAVINSKFPNIGELLLQRLVNQFKRGFKRNNKDLCISSGIFMAHLVNQNVAHEIVVLQLLTLLVENPTDDSIEVAIAVLKECGMKLTELSKRGIEGVFSALRNTLHEGKLDKRVQYMIEVMFQVRKDGFKDHEAVPTELDLVEEDDQITHLIQIGDPVDSQDILNVFKFDPEFQANEEKYKNVSKEILDTDSSSSGEGDSSGEEEEDETDDEEREAKEAVIIDNTETNLIALRRNIYLTIQSSLDFEECAHKLMKMQLKPGQEIELCNMFLDCCAEMRTYEKFYGLLASRFCAINKIYVTQFEEIFKVTYDKIHRFDMNKLRNVAKFFAHLLFTDSISWEVLVCIRLNEDDTSSSGRVFIKYLFQELAEYMGLAKLNARVKDVTLQEAFAGLFPRDNPRDTRFAINFFTSIGLGGLTDDLREHLKNRPKPVPVPPPIAVKAESSSESSSDSSSSSSESSSESSDSSSSSSSSEDEKSRRKKKRTRRERNEKVKKRSSDGEKSDKKEKSSKKRKEKKKKSRK